MADYERIRAIDLDGLLHVVRAVGNQPQDPRQRVWFGLLAGVGFETKYSISFLVLGVLAGLIFTPERRFLKSGWLWLGMSVCGFIALPNFLWQLHNDFPSLPLVKAIRNFAPRYAAKSPQLKQLTSRENGHTDLNRNYANLSDRDGFPRNAGLLPYPNAVRRCPA